MPNLYKDQFKNVPFGNSIFQITTFGHGQETPERQYRNCLLQLDKYLIDNVEEKKEKCLWEFLLELANWRYYIVNIVKNSAKGKETFQDVKNYQ